MYKHGLLVLLFFMIWGCSSQVAFTTKKPANVDSVLFYQSNDLPDPFIDNILSQPGDSATLSSILVPPPPAPSDSLRQIDGFRVQAFAGLDSMRAVSLKSQLYPFLSDTIYILKEGGLFKVQVGDFPYRSDADSIQRRLTINNIAGSWVVARKIFIVSSSASSAPPPAVINDNYKFKIQILATSDEARAMSLSQSLQQQFALPAFYLQVSGMYKVFLGKFLSREEAEPVLRQVRKEGYPDAWLVF